MFSPLTISVAITVSFEEVPPDLPYMIRRSRMHNVPVYMDIKHGSQKSTVVRKVEGDIWVSVTMSLSFHVVSVQLFICLDLFRFV